MPFGDGTGPMGLGPMTGRRAGFCAGFVKPGFATSMPGYPYLMATLMRRQYGSGGVGA